MICEMVRKVIGARKKPAKKKATTLMMGLLKEATKEEILSFVSQKGAKLGEAVAHRKQLLQARSAPSFAPQYVAFSNHMMQPVPMAYFMKPDENVWQANRQEAALSGVRLKPTFVPLSGEVKQLEENEVTRLSARALRQFNKEHGEPVPFGGQH